MDKSGRPGKEQRKWSQLAAYLARSINIIATAYDNKMILEELQKLTKMAKEIERKRKKKN